MAMLQMSRRGRWYSKERGAGTGSGDNLWGGNGVEGFSLTPNFSAENKELMEKGD